MIRYLLDTNLLLGTLSKKSWALDAYDEFQLNESDVYRYTSIICYGEILALATRNQWQNKKLANLRELLDDISVLHVDHVKIAKAYSAIRSWSERQTFDSPGGISPPNPGRSMQQNDLWIAATAHVHKITLLSTDKDFEHLQDAWIEFRHLKQI